MYAAVAWRGGDTTLGVLDAAAAKGELKVTVTDRGELESAESVQVTCELEGGGKITTIVPEGTAVKKGDEVCRLDTDAVTKALNEQEVKFEQAEGKLKAAKSELIQAKAKEAGEVAKVKLALDLAVIDLEAYLDAEGEYKKDLEKLKGAEELAKKKMDEARADLDFTRKMVKDGLAPIDQVRLKEGFLRSEQFAHQSALAELRVLEKFTHRKKVTELTAKAEDFRRELERTVEAQKSAVEKAEGELKSCTRTAEIEKTQLDRMREAGRAVRHHGPVGRHRDLLQRPVLGRERPHQARGAGVLPAADHHPARPVPDAGQAEGPRERRQEGDQGAAGHHDAGRPAQQDPARHRQDGGHPGRERRLAGRRGEAVRGAGVHRRPAGRRRAEAGHDQRGEGFRWAARPTG